MSSVRCSVKCLAALACPSGPTAVMWSGTDVLLSNGGNFVFVFSTSDQTVKAVHKFPSPVRHLVQSPNKRGLYALCERDGIHFIPLQQYHRTQPHALSANDGSGPVNTPHHSRVIADPHISSFAVAAGILVAAVLGDGAWRFHFYEVPEDATTPHRRLVERCLCAAGTGAKGSEDGGTSGRPVLCSVFTRNDTVPERAEGSDADLLDPTLFGLLFGVDASLISCPAAVCGLPDGRLCALPFLQQPGVGHTALRVRVFHSLQEPVVYIGVSGASGAEDASGALVAVGRFGKVLVGQVGQKEMGAVPVFREYSVAGPVAAACVSKTHLYYSTCSDLLALPVGREEQRHTPDLGTDPSHKPVSMNVCGIVALLKPRRDSAGAAELLAVSLAGRLLQVTLPQGSGRGGVHRLSPAQAGQRMKDLLAGVGNVSERASLLKNSIQVRNEALIKLNHAFNICCLLLSNQKGSDGHVTSKPLISFRPVTKWTGLLQQDSLILGGVLENASSYVLEHGWMLHLQVMPSYGAQCLQENASTKTYSFPIEKLAPSDSVEVTLPLALSTELVLPVKVSCSLVYTLQSMLGCMDVRHFFHKGTPLSDLISDKGVIVLAVDTVTVDWLDCLHVDGPVVPKIGSPRSAPSEGFIASFLQARGLKQRGCSNKGPSHWGVGDDPFESVSIRVSSALLRAVFKGLPFKHLSVCGSLLAWLVSSCPGTQADNALERSTVCGRWPSGETVKMTAKEVMVEDASAAGPVLVVELQLESSSVAGLCGVHHAALRRIQALVKEVAKETEGPAQLQAQSLRCALEHAEALWREIQDVMLGTGMSQRVTEKLLQVYQHLRSTQLLVL